MSCDSYGEYCFASNELKRPGSAMVGLHAVVCLCITLRSFQNDPLQAANVHVNANAAIQPRQSGASLFTELPHRCTYKTTAATTATAPAAPRAIPGDICTAAPLALVEAPVVLPVCVCVPLVESPLAAPVGDVEPPFEVVDAPVDVGVEAVLLTEPAVITTGR